MTISANYPSVAPSLELNFAQSGVLDPRVTFSRPTTATYYDAYTSAVAEQNLLLQSQTFGTTWVTTNGTLGTGVTDPAGGTTAYSLTATSANATVYQTLTLTANPYTVSFYIQRVTGTGTINLTLDGTNMTAVSITSSWVRYTATATPTAGSHTVGIQVTTSGDVINIWGAQLEQRSSVTAYNATTTTAITNYIPVLQTASTNQPRFDHDPVARTSLGLLIEEQRTNLLVQSAFASSWPATRSSVALTSNIAPDGTQTAVSLIEDSSNNSHYINQSATVSSGAFYTASVYAKANQRGYLTLLVIGSTASSNTFFNLISGTVVSTSANATSNITSVGNGWYRCSITVTTNATTAGLYPGISADGISSSYQGNGYSGLYIWGAQLEAGAFPTSYIPTVASQVTRSADSASMTGTNFSSWFNISQGNFYCEFNQPNNVSASQRILWVGTSSSQQLFDAYTVNTGVWFNNGTIALNFGTFTPNATTKTAINYAVGAYAGVVNGGTVYTNSANTVNASNVLWIGSYLGGIAQLNGRIKKLAYYPIALSSSALQALTGS
jgi:hypothetical protein